MNWELIVATDVLPYIGELEVFFRDIAQHLQEEGIFAFSTEKLLENDLEGFKVGAYQRFAHCESYIENCLQKVGLKTVSISDIHVREEQNVPVEGQIFIAQK